MKMRKLDPEEVSDSHTTKAAEDLLLDYRQIEAGVIPEDWEKRRLGDIADIFNGATPSTQKPAYWNGDIPWCVPTDITGTSGKYLFETERYITSKGLASCAARLLPVGTLLLCSRATVGEIKIALLPVCTNQGFKSLVCKDEVLNEFLYYQVLTMKPKLIEKAKGSTFLEIGKCDVASIEIPLPPFHEQCAIAEVLSDVDVLIEALEKLIAKKQAIKLAAMQQLLTGKTRLPGFSGEWETKRIGDLGQLLKGSGVSRETAQSGTLACVRYGEIYTKHDNCIREFQSWISEEVAESATRLEYGDLLFTGSGETKEEIGKCVAFLLEKEAYAGGDIIILRPRGVDSLFLGYALNSFEVNRQKASLGQGDAVVHISAAALARVSLSVPPLEEQAAIAAVLSDMDAEIEALERKRGKIHAIKQGMMQQLLTGRVRLVEPEYKEVNA